MKKLLLLSAILVVMLTIALLGGTAVFAEDVEYPCTIVENIEGYGDVLCDIDGGEVGDIATVMAKPYVFCKIDYIKVNDTVLVADEDGLYKFALVAGENIISAKFILDPEQMGAMKEYVAQAEEEGLASLFTMKNLFNLLSWLATMLFGSGMLLTLVKQKMIKKKTSDDVKNTTNETINSNLTTYCDNTFSPKILAIESQLGYVIDIVKTLARCMIIAQENTPESRMAIIEELTKNQRTDKEVAEAAAAIIQAEVDKKVVEKAEQQETIKQLEESNAAIQVEEATPTEEKTEYGQI